MAVSIVVIEGDVRRCIRLRLVARQIPAVHENQIRLSIIVIIEKGHTAAHCFREQLFALGSVLMNEVEAGLLCNVGEMDSRRRLIFRRQYYWNRKIACSIFLARSPMR